MDDARLQKLVAQNAATSRLLGVDFVPRFRRTGAVMPLPQSPVEVAAPEAGPSNAAPDERGLASAAPSSETFAVAPPAAVSVPAGPRDRDKARIALDAILIRYEKEAPHDDFITAHTKIVFGEGDPCARLMFIGEAPGETEDRLGRPFVGKAGELLDKMIRAMGLAREQVYIANVLKTRPPGNRTPSPEECRRCAPYLFAQIDVVQPEVIVTLGLPASRTVLDSAQSMGNLRGRWGVFRSPAGREFPVMPTYHPAFLLRSYTEENRLKVWSDLQQAMGRLGLAGAERQAGNG